MMKNIFIVFAFVSFLLGCKGESGFNESIGGGSGRGGSTARFTISGDNLYVVNSNSLKSFALSFGKDLELKSSVEINAFAETIFPFKNHLLIGTRTGMFIYGLSDVNRPNYVSSYSHFASCDPVVAQGNYAYVTLRNGTPCTRGQNQLDILDISNFNTPFLVKSQNMINPQGLSVSGERLFICEGQSGFNHFDVSDPINPTLIERYSGINSQDVIDTGQSLVITGENGISQYEVGANNELVLLSTIKIGE